MENGNGHGAMTLQKLIDDLKVVLHEGEELMKSSTAEMREKASRRLRETDESIRQNPYPSMGIMFGFGLILGLLAYNLAANTASAGSRNRD